jgi:hypothetical protein
MISASAPVGLVRQLVVHQPQRVDVVTNGQ